MSSPDTNATARASVGRDGGDRVGGRRRAAAAGRGRGFGASGAGLDALGSRLSQSAASPAIAGAGGADDERAGQAEELDQDQAGRERPDDRAERVRGVQAAERRSRDARRRVSWRVSVGSVAPMSIVAGASARIASPKRTSARTPRRRSRGRRNARGRPRGGAGT